MFQPINCLFIPYTDTLQRLAQSPHDSSPNTAINQTSISRAQRSPVQSQSPHIASSIVASLTSSSAQQRPARIGPARPRSYRNTRLGLPRDVPSRPLPCPCHAPGPDCQSFPTLWRFMYGRVYVRPLPSSPVASSLHASLLSSAMPASASHGACSTLRIAGGGPADSISGMGQASLKL